MFERVLEIQTFKERRSLLRIGKTRCLTCSTMEKLELFVSETGERYPQNRDRLYQMPIKRWGYSESSSPILILLRGKSHLRKP